MITDILNLICDEYDLPMHTLRGPSRRAYIVEARQLAMWLLRELNPRLSLETIAEMLGRKDHTTVINALEKIDDLIKHDVEWHAKVHRLKAQIRVLRRVAPMPEARPQQAQKFPASPDRWALFNAAMRGTAYVKSA